jgi:hypothetical protein
MGAFLLVLISIVRLLSYLWKFIGFLYTGRVSFATISLEISTISSELSNRSSSTSRHFVVEFTSGSWGSFSIINRWLNVGCRSRCWSRCLGGWWRYNLKSSGCDRTDSPRPRRKWHADPDGRVSSRWSSTMVATPTLCLKYNRSSIFSSFHVEATMKKISIRETNPVCLCRNHVACTRDNSPYQKVRISQRLRR